MKNIKPSFCFVLILFSSQLYAHVEAGDSLFNDAWDDLFENQTHSEFPLTCQKASKQQISTVNQGGTKVQQFLADCAKATNSSRWCVELTRPNPDSYPIFQCTYGDTQPHLLVHPNKSTWKNAFKAITLIEKLEAMNIKTCLIYNWWRPEPYNGNVGGSPTRHPYGTSVDVRFCSLTDMENAFQQLCKWRRQGQLKAIGYYGGTGLHFGIADSRGNTWGKDCP